MDDSLAQALAAVIGQLDALRSDLADILLQRCRAALGEPNEVLTDATCVQETPTRLQTRVGWLPGMQPTPTVAVAACPPDRHDSSAASERACGSIASARAAAAAATHAAESAVSAVRAANSRSDQGSKTPPFPEKASGHGSAGEGVSDVQHGLVKDAGSVRNQDQHVSSVNGSAPTSNSRAPVVSPEAPEKNAGHASASEPRTSVVTDTGDYEKFHSEDAHGHGPEPIMQKFFGGTYGRKRTETGKRDHQEMLARTTEEPLFVEEKPLRCLQRVVRHWLFDTASAVIVFLSTLLLGIETEYAATHDGQTSEFLTNLQKGLLVLFTGEIVVRLGGQGTDFFCSKLDRVWNAFDSFIVVIGLLEWAVSSSELNAVSSQSRGGKAIRVARLLRILKCVRLGRLMRYANTFRQIVYSLQASVRTLAWTVAIVFLFLYSFAIFLCQATTDYLVESQDGPVDRNSPQYQVYGTVPLSLLTLYKTFTGGQNWGDLLTPLEDMHWMYSVAFLGFITLNFFGVLNVVAAIFVESTLQSQQHHKELLMHDKQVKQLMVIEHLKEIFASIDQRGKGSISAEEMEFILADPDQSLYLESVDITAGDARVLFQLLDQDGNGEISIDEFCNGCLRLKGEAKSMDIHCMIHNTHLLIVRTKRIMDYLDAAIPKTKDPNEAGPIAGLGDTDVTNRHSPPSSPRHQEEDPDSQAPPR